ncbi:MAG: hypothetical protein U1F43_20195 [Myxococcota bacterium]
MSLIRVACIAACAWILGSCAAMNDLMEADKSVRKEAASAIGGPSTCCVNQQFFECPDAPSGLQCVGNPVQMATCSDHCAISDDDCKGKCVADNAPNTSHCTRTPARDGECAK